MAHRATGSGASFTRDHGYRNNCVHMWGAMESMDEMISDIKERKANKIPTFTSIGNQPPAPRKGVSVTDYITCLLYTSPSPRDRQKSRMPSSA